MLPHHVVSVALNLVVAAVVSGEEVSQVFEPIESRSHAETIGGSRATYAIDVGGTVDMDNTTTRLYETFRIAFQNNLSLTIANTGDSVVRNPRVVTNGKRRWWSLEEMLDEILRGARDDQEKALRIWDFVRRNRHHDDPIFSDDELHDPVKLLNVYGAGLCDDSGYVGCSLLHHAGLSVQKYGKTPKVRTLHGHMMCEAILDSGYQFLDIDENAFYLDLENQLPVSGDAIARDHYLAKRDHTYGPKFKGWQIGERAASLFGRDDGSTFHAASGHRIDFDLRPGERIEYRWDNCGRFAADDTRGKQNRRFWGTSLWGYEPRLTVERIAEDAEQASAESIVYAMETPYAVCGGRIEVEFNTVAAAQRTVAVSFDGETWREVWTGREDAQASEIIEIDEALQYKRAPAKYAYYVKVTPGAEMLRSLRIETDLMTSPHALPRLGVGHNTVDYRDETRGEHEVTITHRWRESSSVTPPMPPMQPITPADGSTVASTTVPFEWAECDGATHYHIQVTRTPGELAGRPHESPLPYRPCFDVVIDGNEHEAPFAGMFRPGEPYYWRVRPRDGNGVWGPWGPYFTFTWKGPCIPVDLTREMDGRQISISWKPNPQGTRPVRYEVYGSDERGFTPSRTEYEVRGLGRQPPNLLGTTTKTQQTVVSADADGPGWNRSFYRVVAVDADGVASGPSDLIELPHPFVYSQPVSTAEVGKPYRYELKSLACLGDLQYRYTAPGSAFWEIEGREFELTDGPGWLSLDSRTGVLRGTPTDQDAGVHKVTVTCRRTYPHEVQKTDDRSAPFLKKDPRFQAEDRQSFNVTVR